MDYIDVRELKGKIRPDAKFITLNLGKHRQKILLAYQKNGYGQKRFFLCPGCDKRVQYLYISDKGILKCRQCSGIKYKGIQNNTKGGYDEIAYRMKRYANKHDIKFNFPFNYIAFANDRRCSKRKFRKSLLILQALENMRFQAIMYKRQYSSKLLNKVITGTHPLLQSVNMSELQNQLYDWRKGEKMNELPLPTKEILR